MTKTYTQADLDAAVAAVVEKAAANIEDHSCTGASSYDPFVCGYANGYASCVEQVAESVRALISTDALAERDAKVRADALREAATICAECEETFERREANGAAHGAAMCFKAIQALIKGEE